MKTDKTTKGVKPATKAAPEPKPAKTKKEGKTKFIADLILEHKFTARDIAAKVVAKFPDPALDFDAALAKALRFVRAVPWHLKQKGCNECYVKVNKPSVKKVVPVTA